MRDPKAKIVLGMPGYDGRVGGTSAIAFWHLACSEMKQVDNVYRGGSLLASNFNRLWVYALNAVHFGERVDYFAMLHDDIGPEPYWLDKLIDELEERELDVLSVVVPIKDKRGITSTALAGDSPWVQFSKLTMTEVYQLPETFTEKDVNRPLLLNTGCWVMKWNQDVCRRLHFEINDRIVFNTVLGCYQAQTEPEDWHFSRQCNELGLKIGATRKIGVEHTGVMKFKNDHVWGTDTFDEELMTRSPVPGAFPHDIKGWLTPEEGAKLAEHAAGKRVLEIGSYQGRSTVCMARVAEHVTAVDFFDSPSAESYGDYVEEFDKSILRHGCAGKITKCRPEDSLTGEFDFAFIDGAHDYDSVLVDLEKTLPVLADGGLIAFHDYRSGMDPGVDRVVNELLAEGGELLSLTKTLAVVRPPALIPQEA